MKEMGLEKDQGKYLKAALMPMWTKKTTNAFNNPDSDEPTALSIATLLGLGGNVMMLQIPIWFLLVGLLLCLGAVLTTPNESKALTFPCVLSAVVCTIAALHYYLLMQLRSMRLNTPMLAILARMTHMSQKEVKAAEAASESAGELEELVKKETLENTAILHKVHTFEAHRAMFVDYISDATRFSDWVFTLPLLTLELHMLGEPYVNPATGRWLNLDRWDHAGLSILTVVLAALFRLTLMDGWYPKCSGGTGQTVLILITFLLFWGVAMFLFVLICVQLTGALVSQPSGSSYNHDVVAVMGFQLLQCGYPLVSFVDFVWRYRIRNAEQKQDSAGAKLELERATSYRQCTAFKDLTYGVLDMMSKGGFAVFVSFRILWYNGLPANN